MFSFCSGSVTLDSSVTIRELVYHFEMGVRKVRTTAVCRIRDVLIVANEVKARASVVQKLVSKMIGVRCEVRTQRITKLGAAYVPTHESVSNDTENVRYVRLVRIQKDLELAVYPRHQTSQLIWMSPKKKKIKRISTLRCFLINTSRC